MNENNDMEKGVQPLDQIMIRLNLKNDDLVSASQQQLTFKVLAKGRKGRRLTLNGQTKILKALNARCPETPFQLSDLFNY